MIHSCEADAPFGAAPNAIWRPSGDQAAQHVLPPPDANDVSCVTAVPSGFIVSTSPDAPMNAILPFLPANVPWARGGTLAMYTRTRASESALRLARFTVLDFMLPSPRGRNVNESPRSRGRVASGLKLEHLLLPSCLKWKTQNYERGRLGLLAGPRGASAVITL